MDEDFVDNDDLPESNVTEPIDIEHDCELPNTYCIYSPQLDNCQSERSFINEERNESINNSASNGKVSTEFDNEEIYAEDNSDNDYFVEQKCSNTNYINAACKFNLFGYTRNDYTKSNDAAPVDVEHDYASSNTCCNYSSQLDNCQLEVPCFSGDSKESTHNRGSNGKVSNIQFEKYVTDFDSEEIYEEDNNDNDNFVKQQCYYNNNNNTICKFNLFGSAYNDYTESNDFTLVDIEDDCESPNTCSNYSSQLDNCQPEVPCNNEVSNESTSSRARSDQSPNIQYENNDNGDNGNDFEQQCYKNNNAAYKFNFVQENELPDFTHKGQGAISYNNQTSDHSNYDEKVGVIHHTQNISKKEYNTEYNISFNRDISCDRYRNCDIQSNPNLISYMKIFNETAYGVNNDKNICSNHRKHGNTAMYNPENNGRDAQYQNYNNSHVMCANLHSNTKTNKQFQHFYANVNQNSIPKTDVGSHNNTANNVRNFCSHYKQYNEPITSKYNSMNQQYQNNCSSSVDQTELKRNAKMNKGNTTVSVNERHNLKEQLNALAVSNDNLQNCVKHCQRKNNKIIAFNTPRITDSIQQNNKTILYNSDRNYNNRKHCSDMEHNNHYTFIINENKYSDTLVARTDNLNNFKIQQQCPHRRVDVQPETFQSGEQNIQTEYGRSASVRKSNLTVPKIYCNDNKSYTANNTFQQRNQYRATATNTEYNQMKNPTACYKPHQANNDKIGKTSQKIPKIDCNDNQNFVSNNTFRQGNPTRATTPNTEYNKIENPAACYKTHQRNHNKIEQSRLTIPRKECNDKNSYAPNNTFQQGNHNRVTGYDSNDANSKTTKTNLTVPTIHCNNKKNYAANNTFQQRNQYRATAPNTEYNQMENPAGCYKTYQRNHNKIVKSRNVCNGKNNYAGNNTFRQGNQNRVIRYDPNDDIRKTKNTAINIEHNQVEDSDARLTISRNERYDKRNFVPNNTLRQGNQNHGNRDNIEQRRLTTSNKKCNQVGKIVANNSPLQENHNKTRLTVPNNNYNCMENCNTSQQGSENTIRRCKQNQNLSQPGVVATNYGSNQAMIANANNTFEVVANKAAKQNFKDKILIFGGIDSYCPYCEEESNQEYSYPISLHPYNYYDGDDQVLYYTKNAKRWSNLSRVPHGTRTNHAAVSCNGLIYLIGGTSTIEGCPNNLVYEKSVWSYNPDTFEWGEEVDLPELRSNFAAVAIDNRVKNELNLSCQNLKIGIFVIGGEGPNQVALSSVLFYDIECKVWQPVFQTIFI